MHALTSHKRMTRTESFTHRGFPYTRVRMRARIPIIRLSPTLVRTLEPKVRPFRLKPAPHETWTNTTRTRNTLRTIGSIYFQYPHPRVVKHIER